MTGGGAQIHPRALCETDAVGHGTRVWAFAHVMSGAVVGPDCNICDHAFIEGGAVLGRNVTVKNNVLIWDGVTVEDDVFLGPNVVFTNDLNPRAAHRKDRSQFLPTVVRAGATIGANTTVVCGITVGRSAFIGAGSVVTRDIRDHELVYGNPARARGWVCECGEVLGSDLRCGCARAYEEAPHGLRLLPDPS